MARLPAVLFSLVSSAVVALEASGSPATPTAPAVWRRLGPDVAPITEIAFAQDGATVWLAPFVTHPPQVYRSSDGGNRWSRADGRPGPRPLPVALLVDLASDPGDPATAWVTLHGPRVPLDGARVFRTTDGGATWTQFEADPDCGTFLLVDRQGRTFSYALALCRFDERRGAFVKIALDSPRTSPRALAEGADGALWVLTWGPQTLLRSTDGGGHWQLVNEEYYLQCGYWLVADPLLAGRLWTSSCRGPLLRSDDGGVTFAEVSDRIDVVGPVMIDPRSSDVLFAPGNFRAPSHFLRSADGGRSWQPWATGAPLTGVGGQMPLALDPTDPDRALMGSRSDAGVFATRDGGETWSEVNAGLRGRVDALAAGRGDRLWALVGGTLFGRASATAPWRRSRLHTDYVKEVRVQEVIADGARPATLWANTAVRLLKSGDAGATWSAVGPAQVDGLFADPRTADTLYRAVGTPSSGFLVRSDDGGAHWASTGLKLVGVSRVVAHPRRSGGRALVGALCYDDRFEPECPRRRVIVAESSDGGQRWRRIRLDARTVAIAYARASPHALLVATSGGLFRHGDAGGAWQRLDRRRYLDLAAGTAHLYALVRDAGGTLQTLRSGDDGVSWRALSAGLGPRPSGLRVVPGNPDRVYAATLTGVYELAAE